MSARIICAAIDEAVDRFTHDPASTRHLASHTGALQTCLKDTLGRALADESWPGPRPLVALCRKVGIGPADLDLLAHHVLTTLLAHRPGPHALVRAGATFAAATRRLPPEHTSTPPPRQHATHSPMAPTWTCSGCAQDWPCVTQQQQLRQEFHGSAAALGLYLGSCFAAAIHDLPTVPQDQLRRRFLDWLPHRPSAT
ncbi:MULTISPECIES: hypothetical protein [unclassified Micromonospora]|uniref:hypothetical protein n=1 Tax=unclassified Micromonospora TaxID=2617518 RepID=UPI00331DB8F8